MNKFNIGASLVIPSLASVLAFAVDGGEKQLMLQIVDSYSQCSAYYELAATLPEAKSEAESGELAKQHKSDAWAMAQAIAERLVSLDLNDKEKVKQVATQMTAANYDTAIQHLHQLAASDQKTLSIELAKYQSDCALALADPRLFTGRTLATQTSPPAAKPVLAQE